MAQKLSFVGTECSLYCNVNETENTASVKVKYNNNFLHKRDSVTRFFTSLFSSSKDSTCAPHEQFGNFFVFVKIFDCNFFIRFGDLEIFNYCYWVCKCTKVTFFA